jgi:hypothetical protein
LSFPKYGITYHNKGAENYTSMLQKNRQIFYSDFDRVCGIKKSMRALKNIE